MFLHHKNNNKEPFRQNLLVRVKEYCHINKQYNIYCYLSQDSFPLSFYYNKIVRMIVAINIV